MLSSFYLLLIKTMELNEYIKIKRKERGLTQVELAKKLGKTQPQISAWESGERKPTKKNMDGLIEHLKLDLATVALLYFQS